MRVVSLRPLVVRRVAIPEPSLLFPLIIIFFDALGAGLVLPVVPSILEGFSSGPSDRETVAQLYGVLITVYAGAQFVSAPLVGSLADRFGRRPILLVSTAASALDHFVVALAPDLSWLYIGRFCAGLSAASFVAALAYVADISTPGNRGRNFGFVGGAYAVGLAVGPAAGGLLGAEAPRLPLYVAGTLMLGLLLWGQLTLVESLPVRLRRRFELRRSNPLAPLRFFRRTPAFAVMGVTLAVSLLPQRALDGLWVLFLDERLAWGTTRIGIALTVAALAMGLAQGVLAGPVIRRWSEPMVVSAGLGLLAVSCVGFGLATSGLQFYAWLLPFALGGMQAPALASMFSARVGPEEQGELQGALSSVRGLMAVLGPLLGAWIFAASLEFEDVPHASGLVYYAFAAPLLLVALIIFLRGRAGVFAASSLDPRQQVGQLHDSSSCVRRAPGPS